MSIDADLNQLIRDVVQEEQDRNVPVPWLFLRGWHAYGPWQDQRDENEKIWGQTTRCVKCRHVKLRRI